MDYGGMMWRERINGKDEVFIEEKKRIKSMNERLEQKGY